ncbi:hypothetical protein PMAYCL1PPCAC_03512, partial [Pristionchus mayeri]
LALVALCASLALPSKGIQLDDNCGAVSVGIQLSQKYSNAISDHAKCQICLDLAILVDNYIDCAEGFLQTKANEWCETTFTEGYYRDVCYDLVNSIIDTLEKDTDNAINGPEICTKVMKEPC